MPVLRISSPPSSRWAMSLTSLTCTQRTRRSSCSAPARTTGSPLTTSGNSSTSATVGSSTSTPQESPEIQRPHNPTDRRESRPPSDRLSVTGGIGGNYRGGMVTRITHWIDGAATDGTSGRTAPVFNPATGEQTGEVDLASSGEVDAAVAAAKAAATEWRSASLSRRSAILFAFRELLHE